MRFTVAGDQVLVLEFDLQHLRFAIGLLSTGRESLPLKPPAAGGGNLTVQLLDADRSLGEPLGGAAEDLDDLAAEDHLRREVLVSASVSIRYANGSR